ncbi:hypothetical protein ACFORL_07155 [Legionella dresdenensis]|uniref:HTH psq-type domain-containing protein n=1 Tax=Legionella dresdenensis TaxID=450200 RepID=A0ABV8CF83_9GAMM
MPKKTRRTEKYVPESLKKVSLRKLHSTIRNNHNARVAGQKLSISGETLIYYINLLGISFQQGSSTHNLKFAKIHQLSIGDAEKIFGTDFDKPAFELMGKSYPNPARQVQSEQMSAITSPVDFNWNLPPAAPFLFESAITMFPKPDFCMSTDFNTDDICGELVIFDDPASQPGRNRCALFSLSNGPDTPAPHNLEESIEEPATARFDAL